MSGSSTSKQKRTAAGILGILLLLIMLFSASYIASEADHDCTGEDCPVCACMQQCKNTLNQICGGAALMAAAFIPVVFVSVSTLLIAFAYPQETLVSRKVRLNN